ERRRGRRAGAEHQQARGRDARRAHRGRERARPWIEVLLHGAALRGRRTRMKDRTVLHIEDNEYNRKIVRQLLSRTSYRLLEAADGEEGLAGAQRRLPGLLPLG